MDALSDQLGAAAATLGSTGLGIDGDALDEVAERLHRIEALLEELAADPDATAAAARQMRLLRDEVSVHLSAAASLRLLDLHANAAVVLRRAVDSVRAPVATFGDVTQQVRAYDAG